MFVVLEGGEGVGKSTHVGRLCKRLRETGRTVKETFEPGATPLGAAIRGLLLMPGAAVDPRTEALLYAADRAQHLASVVRPALERGEVVVSDRFLWSSLAYQGAGRGLGVDAVLLANSIAVGALRPDVVVVLDVPPEVGLQRASHASGGVDRIEGEGLSFHRAVREAFLALAAVEGGVVVDATASRDTVAQQVWDAVAGALG